MYVCVYVYRNLCMYVYTATCVCMCVCMYVCVYVYRNLCVQFIQSLYWSLFESNGFIESASHRCRGEMRRTSMVRANIVTHTYRHVYTCISIFILYMNTYIRAIDMMTTMTKFQFRTGHFLAIAISTKI